MPYWKRPVRMFMLYSHVAPRWPMTRARFWASVSLVRSGPAEDKEDRMVGAAAVAAGSVYFVCVMGGVLAGFWPRDHDSVTTPTIESASKATNRRRMADLPV